MICKIIPHAATFSRNMIRETVIRELNIKEILMIIIIFGLVAVVAGIALNNSRRNTRDTIRVTDVVQMQNALELYFFNCNKYPTEVVPGGIIGDDECGGPYLSFVSSDPRTNSPYYYVPCVGTGPFTCEAGLQEATSYQIYYSLEGKTGKVPLGNHIAVPGKLY